MSNRVKSVLFFRNGNIAAFDGNGEQTPLLQQKTIMDLFRDFAECNEFDAGGCEYSIQGGESGVIKEWYDE
jgi:hypothetical protein